MSPEHGPASAETIETRTYAQVTRNNLQIPNYQQPSSTRHHHHPGFLSSTNVEGCAELLTRNCVMYLNNDRISYNMSNTVHNDNTSPFNVTTSRLTLVHLNIQHIEYTAGCFNCGEENHAVSTCKYSEKLKCHTCHKMGHKSTVIPIETMAKKVVPNC